MCYLHWTLHKSDGPDLWFLCVCAFILWTVLWMHTWAIWYLTLCWIILCLPFTPRLWHCHYEWNCEMRPWMHRTHPLMCIAETRDGHNNVQLDAQDPHPLMCIASQARLRLDNADAHLPTSPLGTILMQKKQNAHTWSLSVFLQSQNFDS